MRFTFGIEFDDEVMVGAVKWVKRYLMTPMGGWRGVSGGSLLGVSIEKN